MSTSKILFRGASIPYGGVAESDIPFPQSEILMRLGADWVVADTDSRAVNLVDYAAGAEYLVGTGGKEPLFELTQVNGINVLDGGTTEGDIDDYDGFIVNSSSGPVVVSEAWGDKEALTVAALVAGPAADADFSVGPSLLGLSTTGVTAAMFRIYYPNARAVSLTARHTATSDSANQCNMGGIVPGRFHLLIAELNFVDHWIALEVDGVRRQMTAFAGKTGNSVTPSGLGMGWGMQRNGSASRSKSQFTGKLREAVWFNGLLDAEGKRLLREYFVPFQRRLNGED